MPAPSGPHVFTIPPHRAFADALAAGLIARFGAEPGGLARGLILVPNNRAARAIADAFVRRSAPEGAKGGLLLPRMVPVGDEELEARIGGALEPLDSADPVPPAIDPVNRLMLLARLVQHERGEIDAAGAMRLARDLARTIDQLLIERVDPARLAGIAANLPDLSLHWQKNLDRLRVLLDVWPRLLDARGEIELAERRNRLLDGLAKGWRSGAPHDFIVAAGITTSAPAVAALLRVVARLPQGLVVFPGLDLAMDQAEWDMLGPHAPDPETQRATPSIETHPQYHLKLLLDRIGVARAEVASWRWGGGRDSPAVRSRAISNAMAPAAATGKWQVLKPVERRLSGVRALELADPSEEAQAIAIALREALEVPGRTAALVTPDRMLARRVSAHLKRWKIEADDSAGRPLSETPPGTLLLALADAGAERFAPVPLLALLKHPLVRKGEGRGAWLEGARRLDLALRGPRPPAGLDGISDWLKGEGRDARLRVAAAPWWRDAAELLRPLEAAFAAPGATLASLTGALREAAAAMAGEDVWAGPAGRAAAELIEAIEAAAPDGPERIQPCGLAPLLQLMMEGMAVRPPFGQHPRIFMWGLLEARLQQADLMILAGLNEGTWPALPAPDPWLAPRIRAELGLPGLERRIGLAAHDFASALGGRDVLVTRARREGRSPAVASRFWLRLEAMTGGLTRAPHHRRWAQALDRPATHSPADQPKPAPASALRPRDIAVTDVDRLKADPFAFYARKMLRLAPLDAIDADPSAAWRGTAVHQVLEEWMKSDDCDPDKLRSRAEALLRSAAAHPLMRALWQPRLLEAIDFIAAEVAAQRAEGRRPLRAEAEGSIAWEGGITLKGKADRIDVDAAGRLVIIDYKTGTPPRSKAVAEGFAMQLGLLGLIAERGGFADVEGIPAAFEYWSLAKKGSSLGFVSSPVGRRSGLDPAEFTTLAARQFESAAALWLLGEEPFTAKLHPAHAPYGEYDQLMRLDEWYGREGSGPE